MPKTEKQTYSSRSSEATHADIGIEDFIVELSKPVPLPTKAATVLQMLIEHTSATQAAVFQVHEGYVLPRRFRWPREATAKNGYHLQYRNSLESLGIAHWERILTNKGTIQGNTKDFKGKEQEFLQRDGALSFIIIPIIMEPAGWWGFIELTDCQTVRTWPDDTVTLLQSIAEELGKAMYDDELNATMNMTKADLIELRLREELLSAELDEINHWKNQILSAFSHEFQTPLYTLLGFSKTLLENEELDDDKEIRMTCLQHIHDQSRRLEKLVNTMMFASRLHTKTLRVEKQLIDFRTVLNAIRVWVDPKANTQGVEFSAEFPEDNQQVTCDPGKIERVLQNILENALNNTPANGWVSMKVLPEKNHIVIIIADTGTGISKERIGRIFEPFFTASTGHTTDVGVGLGLSIAKEIVDLHNGFITVESKEGEGSVFTITLPRNNKESVLAIH